MSIKVAYCMTEDGLRDDGWYYIDTDNGAGPMGPYLTETAARAALRAYVQARLTRIAIIAAQNSD